MLIELNRRGFKLGSLEAIDDNADAVDELNQLYSDWGDAKAVVLRNVCDSGLVHHADSIKGSERLYSAVIEQRECDSLLAEKPYQPRLQEKFEPLGSSFNEGDEQEIETLLFDAIDGEKILAEDLWVKISWLSFYENDASLRFRFSFGVDFEEDVAADPNRQYYAAALAEAMFPESKVITDNSELMVILCKLLDCESVDFVERIIYFNAPDGGAYLHHDRERGHAGVVYTQLTGSTYWLALAKHTLTDEINTFIANCVKKQHWPASIDAPMQTELIALRSDQNELSAQLESFSNTTLIQLINETESFIHQLIQNGYGNLLRPGDIILLPQKNERDCCWHSVFNVGEHSGQALSFAVRAGA